MTICTDTFNISRFDSILNLLFSDALTEPEKLFLQSKSFAVCKEIDNSTKEGQ